MGGFVVVCLLHYNEMNEKQIRGSERYRLKLLLTDLFLIDSYEHEEEWKTTHIDYM